MSMLRGIVRKLTLKYFNWQLNRGKHQSIYKLHDRWQTGSNSVSLGIVDATWEMQDRLIKEFGYEMCPSCGWAAELQGEHVRRSNSWCWEQYQLVHPQKFYILERKLEQPGHLDQLGIVVAESVEHAAHKLGTYIVEVVRPPESAVVCAELGDNYWLTETSEITSLSFLEGK